MSALRRSARVAAQKVTTAPKIESKSTSDLQPPLKKLKKETATPAPKSTTKEVKKESTPLKTDQLAIGDEIPDIVLKDENDTDVKLKELAKENRILVIFAYPRASTPGCTRQACGFRDNYPVLKDKATVVGLSADSPKAQKTFVTKQKLPYKLLCDPSRGFIGQLGAKKTPAGIIRSHWIFVDGKLKISKVGISPEQSVNGAKEDVEKLAKEL